MYKLLILSLLAAPGFAQLCAISGSFKAPDGTGLNGSIAIRLVRSSVKNTCSSPVQVVAFKQAVVKITNGTIGSLSLYANSCLNPNDPYEVKVYDVKNVLLYTGRWVVPNTGSCNVGSLDAR